MNVDWRHVPDKFTAGFRLLDKFETQWEQIHRMSEGNAEKAKIALTKLNSIDQSCARRLDALNKFMMGCKSLANLDEQINNISCDLKKLESSFIKIEEQLLLLRVRKEQMNAERFIGDVEGNYEAQVKQCKIQAEIRKDKLMDEHLQRVQDFEREQQQQLEERRRVLEKEFEEEKNRYLEKKAYSDQQHS